MIKNNHDHTQISRVTRTHEEAKIAYNQISPWYDLLAGRFEKKYRDICVQKLHVSEGERVLEIGFGTGSCILRLASFVGHSGDVYGVDISEAMCEITRTKVKQAGFEDRVDLRCHDAIHLPFDTNIFNAVLMNFTLELFDTAEIPMVLSECRRVLLNKGRIGIVSLSKKQGSTAMMGMYEWVHRSFPRLVDCRPIFVEDAVVGAGFQPVNVSRMSIVGLPVDIVIATKK